MTLAIEPMVTMGSYRVKILDDDWTTVTVDGSDSAYYEHTIVITEDGYEIFDPSAVWKRKKVNNFYAKNMRLQTMMPP